MTIFDGVKEIMLKITIVMVGVMGFAASAQIASLTDSVLVCEKDSVAVAAPDSMLVCANDSVAKARQDSAYIAQQTAEIERLLMMAEYEAVQRQYEDPPRLSVKQAIVPAALLLVGTAAVWDDTFGQFNRYAHDHLEKKHLKIDGYLQYGPLAMKVGLGLFGVKKKYGNVDGLLQSVTSMAVMYGMIGLMKATIHEPRPNDPTRFDSYPSSQVARSFRSAENMRLEYGNWWGLGGYTFAMLNAYFRLRNGKVWVNDVIGSMAIGILSARVGYWLVPLEKKLLGLGKMRHLKASMVVVPYYEMQSRSVCTAVAMTF